LYPFLFYQGLRARLRLSASRFFILAPCAMTLDGLARWFLLKQSKSLRARVSRERSLKGCTPSMVFCRVPSFLALCSQRGGGGGAANNKKKNKRRRQKISLSHFDTLFIYG